MGFKLLAVELLVPAGEAAETFAEGCRRTEVEIMLQFGDIREGGDDVARLHGDELLMGFEIVVGGQDVGGDKLLLQDRNE